MSYCGVTSKTIRLEFERSAKVKFTGTYFSNPYISENFKVSGFLSLTTNIKSIKIKRHHKYDFESLQRSSSRLLGLNRSKIADIRFLCRFIQSNFSNSSHNSTHLCGRIVKYNQAGLRGVRKLCHPMQRECIHAWQI